MKMLRRIATTVVQSRGLKNQVKINWVRPDYVPAYKPQRSGDLEAVPPVPDSAAAVEYSLSKELKDAPESVKKIFSVAYKGKKERNAVMKKELADRVRRHNYDDNSEEVQIAQWTAQIRWLQEVMEKYPRHVVAKVAAQEIIDKRKKKLKFLRQYDYKKFEWLLEKLNIVYKGHPESHHKLSRKESLRRLTEMHCDDIRNKKLSDYRNLLESQQGPFLQEKLDALRFIKKEQEELQLSVTVTAQDIKKIEKQLDEWKARDELKKQAQRKKKNVVLDLE